MAYEGPEYWTVIYKAVGDFGSLMRDAAQAKAALQGMSDAVKAETAAEVAGATQAASARQKDIQSIQQETQALQQLANAAKSTNSQLIYGGRNDMTQHLSDLAQELNYTTLLNRQKWLGFSSVQQAMAYRQQMYNLALLENRAHFAGYQTADQFLGFLQKEISQTAALSSVIRDRTAAIAGETSALLAHTNALQGTHQTAGALGEQLTSASAFAAALTGIPDVVSTRLVVDDAAAMAELAAYRAALLSLPRSETTDIISSATRLGGVPLTGPRPDALDMAGINRTLSQLSAETVRPRLELEGGPQAVAEVEALDAGLKALPDKKVIYVEADDEDALDDFNYLDSLMEKFDRVPAHPQIETTGLEPAAGLMAAISQEMHDIGEQDVVINVNAAGAIESVQRLGDDWDNIPADLKDAGDSLDAFTTMLAEAARKKYEFEAGLDDSEALDELDVLEGKIVSAEEHGKALMSLLGQGGASGGGGGGGPPPRGGAAGFPEPDPNEGSAWESIAAELDKVDALYKSATRDAAAAGAAGAKAGKDTAQAVTSMVLPLTNGAAGWLGLLTQVNLFGGLLPGILGHTTAIHFVLDAIIETLAILVPAIVTLAAGLTAFGIAGYDAGKQVYDRLIAIHTAADATGQSIAPLTGNLEKLHNTVRPQVWQLYGDAIDVAGQKSGLFNQLAVQTGNVVDRLAARLSVDLMSSGKGLETFLGVGAQDLAKLGQIFSNLGQAFLALIKVTQDTHVDQIFLNIFVALSKLADLITKLPTPLLAAVVGLHAFWLWGGLLATVVLQLLNPLRSLALALGAVNAAEVEGGLASLGKDASAFERLKAGFNDIAAGLGAIPARFSLFSRSAGEAATAAEGTAVAAEDLGAAAGGAANAGGGLVSMLGRLAPSAGGALGGVALLAAALAGAYVYLGLLPDSTQKWINSLNQAQAKATAFTVVSTTVGNLAAVTTELAKAQATGVGNVTELAGAQQGLNTQLGTELSHVGQVSKAYGTDFVGALELLNTAGVKTSDIFSAQGRTWEADLQQVKGLVAGYAAMGQGLTALQQDVSVQLVTTSDQVTAMGKLNSAWDTWTKTVAGAPSAFLAADQGFQTFAADAKVAGASMTGLSAPSLTLQKDFQANYSNVQTFFDAFRNDQALTGQGNFTQFVKDAVDVLIPMAGGSKEAAAQISALAQEAGGPATDNIKTLQQWVGNIKDPLQQMYKASNDAAIGASNLSQDAQRLTSTLQKDLNPAMATAIFNAHGGQGVFNAFADALVKSGPNSKVTIDAAKNIATELEAISGKGTAAKSQFVGFVEAMGLNAKQADKLWAQATEHITANLGQVRKGLSQTASTPANIVKPGEVDTILGSFKSGTFAEGTFLAWIPQVQNGLKTMNHAIGVFFTHDIPEAAKTAGHAFEAAWDGMVNWFTQSVPHALELAWDKVSQFFDKSFTHDIPNAWDHAWGTLVSPVTHAFDDVKNYIASNFDNWWKTHGSAVKSVWDAVWNQMRNDALGIWHFIEGDAKAAWNGIVGIFTSGAAKDIWHFISSGATGAWQLAVSTAKASWTEIEGLGKAAWDVVAAVAKAVWDALWQFIVGEAKGTADTVVGIFKAAWAVVQAAGKIVWDTIVLIVNEILDIITGHWQTAWKDMESYGIQVWNAIKTAAVQVWNAISTATMQVWNAIWGSIKTGWTQVTNALRTGAQQAWSAIWHALQVTFVNPMASFFTATVPKWWNSFASFASTTWGKVWNGFNKDVLQPVEKWFTSTLPNAMWNSLKGGIDRVIGGINTVIGFINAVTSVVGIHIGTIPTLAHGGPVRMASGSVPGTGDEDGTHIIAMGGEYMLRKPARMALQAAYGPDFLDHLNQADSWLGAGSRGNTASQRPGSRGRYAAGGNILSDIGNWLGSAAGAVTNVASDVWHGVTTAAADVAKFGEKAVFDGMWTVSGAPAEKALEALGTPGDMGASWLQQVHNGVESWLTEQTAKAQATIPAAGSGGGLIAAMMKNLAAARGWTGAQWNALFDVEQREAGFNMTATNPTSGAYGLAQFINGPSEYAQYGGNSTTALGQVTAMLNYIAQRYGSPEMAWQHETQYGWYAGGGPVGGPLAVMPMMAGGGPVVSGGHVISVDNNEAILGWNGKNATYYTTVIRGPGPINGHTGRTPVPKGYFSGLQAGHTYGVAVTPHDAAGKSGPAGTITLVTTKGSGHVLHDTGSPTGSTGGTGSTAPPLPPGIGMPGPGSLVPGAGAQSTAINLAPLITGGPKGANSGGYGFTFASGGEVPTLSSVAAMFGGGMAAGGVVPNLFVPGLSANLSRQLTAATSGQLPRTLSDAAGNRVGLQVDNLTINNPVPEKPSDSITRSSNRLAFLGGRGMV